MSLVEALAQLYGSNEFIITASVVLLSWPLDQRRKRGKRKKRRREDPKLDTKVLSKHVRKDGSSNTGQCLECVYSRMYRGEEGERVGGSHSRM